MALNDVVSVQFIKLFTADISTSVYPENGNLNEWLINNYLSISYKNDELTSSITGKFEIKIAELNFNQTRTLEINSYLNEIYIPITISTKDYNIELWYPNGYGEQKLYKIEYKIEINNAVYESKETIGFRSVELVQEPMNGENNGLSFYFKINKIPIFLKGSNWIPADSFKDNITDNYLNWLLYSAKDAHMNVLRIWGGGVYENEYFYDLADKYGIMIWQDFMFACATYPTNEDFLSNVRDEVRYQVLRLRKHPSIIIWAGNNENEALVGTNWFGTNSNRQLYETDYRKLYVDTVRNVLFDYDPVVSRPYLSSSPTNGLLTEQEPNWVSSDPYNLKYGDLHFYDYYINSWEPTSWPVPRLASEYGFQSYPSLSTLKNVYAKSDLNFYSDLNEHRQHRDSQEGNKEIEFQIMFHTKTGKYKDPIENFNNYIYLSQIYQAMSLKVYNELLRRSRDYFNISNGIGNTMGAMYWQYNDIWQAPTWSSLEYGGKWKISHYYVKRSFAPVLISPSIDHMSRKLNVHVISDLNNVTFTDTLVIRVFSYDSFNSLIEKSASINLQGLSTVKAFEWSLDDIKKETNCEYNATKSCLITFSFQNHHQSNYDGENVIFLNDFFHRVDNLQVPVIEILSIKQNNELKNVFDVKLKSSNIALFVWLDLDTSEIIGRFTDNGFHMTNEEIDVQLMIYDNKTNVNTEFLKSNIKVRSLVLLKNDELSNSANGILSSSFLFILIALFFI